MNQTNQTLQQNSQEVSVARISRWYYEQHSWSAYQLVVNGKFVMNARQMASPMKQLIKEAKGFVEANKLTSLLIKAPNKQVITAYPLTTVARYWEYLLANERLPPSIKKKYNWADLIESLKDEKSKQLKAHVTTESQQLKLPTPISATPVILKLQKKLYLEVLVLPGGEYRISFEAGMSIVKLFPNWLLELPNCPNKLRNLEKKGFTGLSKQCNVETGGKCKITETLSIKDWLTIWEHLAGRANTKAAAVLRACAEKTITQRLESTKIPETAQVSLAHKHVG